MRNRSSLRLVRFTCSAKDAYVARSRKPRLCSRAGRRARTLFVVGRAELACARYTCAARAAGCGRAALGWERAWRACGRPSLGGTTGTAPPQWPRALGAEEPLPRGARPQGDGPTTVGGGGCLGVSAVAAAETETWERGDGACATAAQGRRPADQAPLAGTPRARRGARGGPRARWGGAVSPRAGSGSTPARGRGGARASRGPGRALRPPPHGRVPRVCGAWRRGPRRLAAGRGPRGWCSGVAGGPPAPQPMRVPRPTAPPRRLLAGAPLQTDGSTPGAPATPPPRAPGWRDAPWRGQGTGIPLAHACGGTSRCGWRPVTPATACSLTHTGCITA